MGWSIEQTEPPARVRGLIAATVVFSVFTNLLMLTGPLFMLQIYDRVLGSRSEETLVALSILVAGLYLLYWLLEYARVRVMARVGARVQSSMNAPVFRAILERAALRTGPQRGSVADLDAIRTALGSPGLLALLDLPWTPVFLLGIFIFHPTLGWLACLGGGLLIGVAVLNQLLTARKTRAAGEIAAQANSLARQATEGGELAWSQGMTQTLSDRWTQTQDQAVEVSLMASDWTGSFSSFIKAFRLFLQSAMLAAGAWLVLQGQMTAGAMIAGSILLGRALAPIEMLVGQWSMFQRSWQGWRDIRALLEDMPDTPAPMTLPTPEPRLEIASVTYLPSPKERPVLQAVSLSLAPGEGLGVIGRSGSGKSTLARVMVGLLRPVSGEVRLGGATLDQFGPEALGRHIGYLPQEVRLFDGTVAENIARMQSDAPPQAIIDAAHKARMHDVILSLPQGYDTRIGTSSAQLSGGQKQRLALARALYGDPVLLVLDEPNSALDADGSEALNAAMAAMKSDGKSVIIMTHRPTAISACDRLLVLDEGKVAAYGPRDDIIKSMMKNAGDVQKVVVTGGAAR
jgi:ATP-binding cassette subfamily C protein